MTPGHAAGMDMTDVLEVVADRLYDIPFHQLGLEYVIQDLEVRRVDPLDHINSPAHVIEQIDLYDSQSF